MSLQFRHESDQCREALALANEVRFRRADMKRGLTREQAAVLLEQPPTWMATMRVIDVLIALPHWGRVKAGQALRAGEMSSFSTVGGISKRQREALSRCLMSGRTR